MTDGDSAKPGTYSTADGSPVDFATALALWSPLAYDELLATARTYRAVTTYTELSEQVQELSGVRTRMLLTNWIGKLLETVATRAKAEDEVPLTSLCVRKDGTIGPGYAKAPKSVVDKPGEDIEFYAAAHRLLCYQKHASDLPADGGQPALTKTESDRRGKAAKAPRDRKSEPRTRCTSCFTELPASGRCDYCT